MKTLLRSNISVLLGLLLGVLGTRDVEATQPPPPTTHTLTLLVQGGDIYCKGGLYRSEQSGENSLIWQVGPGQFSVEVGMSEEIEIESSSACPTDYELDDIWASDPSLSREAERGMPFDLDEDTTVFVKFSLFEPKVVGFGPSKKEALSNGGLYVEYVWNSSTGDRADLAGQNIFEVLCYDLTYTFKDHIQPFLCSGDTETSGEITLDPPWDTLFGALPLITVRKPGTAADYPEENPYGGTDNHTPLVSPTPPQSWSGGETCYTVKQMVCRSGQRCLLVCRRRSVLNHTVLCV